MMASMMSFSAGQGSELPPSSGKSKAGRRSVAQSCAECRRLKLKCTRNFPCDNCKKKGCAAICPDGSLTTGKGNRFVLANTEVLHEKIETLSNRVRQLEDALGQVYGSQTGETHPLLTPELLAIKRPLERENPNGFGDTGEKADGGEGDETGEAIDAFGSLSIQESGRSRFFGQTANAWYLLQNEDDPDQSEELGIVVHELPLPTNMAWLSYAFPFGPNVKASANQVRDTVMNMLPDPERAQQLANFYFRHAAWMYTPIPEDEFYRTTYHRFYGGFAQPAEPLVPHRLGVLYMVFALGALLDLSKPFPSQEATQYYALGRASLSLGSIFDEPSIPAIQALILMCHYMFLSNIEGPRWAIMGLAVKLAQTVGLHRDSGKWNLDPEETQQRRSLLWELYTYDSWQSLTFGRPPSFSMAQIDCKMAFETRKNERGEVEMSFAAWKHRFASQCLSVVHDQVFGARSTSYATVQKLDKAVRGFYVPPSLHVPGFGGARDRNDRSQPSIELQMQRFVVFAIKEITLFYMHRGFFAKAIEEHAEDPLRSKYAPSVLAAYNSACSFIGLINSMYSSQPELSQRMWFLFAHMFSCAVVLGAITTKCPTLALAPSASSNLMSAHSLFQRLSDNPRAAKVLPVLERMRQRAQSSMSNSSMNHAPSRAASGDDSVKREEDEWATLGGRTRLVPRKSAPVPAYQERAPSAYPLSPHSPASTSTSSPPSYDLATPPPSAISSQDTAFSGWDAYPPQVVEDPTSPNMFYASYNVYESPQPQVWTGDAPANYEQWQAPPMNVSPQVPYTEYDHMDSLKGYYMPADPHMQEMSTNAPSPFETTMDMADSWKNLYVQYA